MNYLAHAYLSGTNGDILLGNFIADSLTTKEEATYKDDVLKGIVLHKAIDKFTDRHDSVREAVRMLRANHGKYAPVVTDLLWDHILIKFWSDYSDENVHEFISSVYKIVIDNKSILPKKLKPNIDRMVTDNFMVRYETLEGLRDSLSYMDRRTKFPSNFTKAIDDYQAQEDRFDDLFNQFFPDLIQLADSTRNA